MLQLNVIVALKFIFNEDITETHWVNFLKNHINYSNDFPAYTI